MVIKYNLYQINITNFNEFDFMIKNVELISI